jgi:predicted amidohydrolase YtcJ
MTDDNALELVARISDDLIELSPAHLAVLEEDDLEKFAKLLVASCTQLTILKGAAWMAIQTRAATEDFKALVTKTLGGEH